MADNTINVKIREAYDTEANWNQKNPVLLQGQIAISSDKHGMYKVGDGTKNWSELSYASHPASQLETPKSIDGVQFDGQSNIIHYGECSTVASTATKAVSCAGFTLETGAVIYVRFTVTNTADVADLKLNVNSTGAKGIKYRNANLPAVGDLAANRTYCFVYDGTYWQWVGDRNTNDNNYVRQENATGNTNRALLLSYNVASSTDTVTNRVYKNSAIYANPSTGKITATGFIGNLEGSADRVNNHTVESNVPQNAVFTDTTALDSMTGTLPIAHGGTGATTALEATQNLGVFSYKAGNDGSTLIPANADLNDYITPGAYHSNESTKSKTLTNTPITTSGFRLFVQGSYSTNYLWQFVIGADTISNKIYCRRRNASSGWSNWGCIYSTTNKPSKADIGLENVENKSSATIRGEITSSNVTTALGYTPSKAQDIANAIDDLEIGGRNLLKDSHKAVSNGNYAMVDYYFGDRPPLNDEIVTLQVKGTLASTKTSWQPYNSGGSISAPALKLTSQNYDSTTGIYTATGQWKVGTASNTYLRLYAATSSQSGTSSIEWAKLERGDKATDWTYAPEDLVKNDFTANCALVTNSSGNIVVSDVTQTELGYLDGVTSAIQTQLNGKQASITGGASSIVSSNLTASRALVSDSSGKVVVSDVTSTELGYLDGVTSAIQTQINGKQASLGYTPVNKAGDTMNGMLTISRSASGQTGVTTKRTDSGMSSAFFGVGSAGVNHGVYSNTLGKWILHADSSKVYLNGTEVPASPEFTDTVTKVKGDKQTTYATGEVNLTPANIGAVNITSGFGQTLNSYQSSDDNAISGTVVKYSTNGATGKPTGIDHALFQMAYSGVWKTQLAQDWRTNKAYIRNCNNGTWGNWAELYSTNQKPQKSDVGLANVENKSSETIRGEITSQNVTTALGYTPVNKTGDTMTGQLTLKPASGEGGQICLDASTAQTAQGGIYLDQFNSAFRIFGKPSSDGSTGTGAGTILTYEPYNSGKLAIGGARVMTSAMFSLSGTTLTITIPSN